MVSKEGLKSINNLMTRYSHGIKRKWYTRYNKLDSSHSHRKLWIHVIVIGD